MTLLISLLTSLAVAQDADVRFINLSPDAGDLEAYAGGTLYASGVGYLEGSSAVAVAAGFQTAEIAESGSGGANPYVSTLISLDAGESYNVVAYGDVATMALLSVIDDNSAVPAGTNRLQLSHVAEGVADIDVFIPGTGSLSADDLPYGANDTILGPDGEITIVFDVDDDQWADYIFDMPDLGTGRLLNLLVIGEEENLSMVVWEDDGTISVVDGVFIPKPTLRYIQLSPDLPAVDMYVGFGFDPLIEGSTYGTMTVPQSVSPGPQGITLTEAGLPPTSSFLTASGNFQPETDYVVMTYGPAANLRGKAFPDPPPHDTDQTVRIVHGSALVTRCQVLADGVAQGITRRGDSVNFLHAPGAFTLELDEGGDGVVEYTFDVPDTGSDHVNLFFATNDAFETRLYIDYGDGSLDVVDPL